MDLLVTGAHVVILQCVRTTLYVYRNITIKTDMCLEVGIATLQHHKRMLQPSHLAWKNHNFMDLGRHRMRTARRQTHSIEGVDVEPSDHALSGTFARGRCGGFPGLTQGIQRLDACLDAGRGSPSVTYDTNTDAEIRA